LPDDVNEDGRRDLMCHVLARDSPSGEV